MGAKLVYPWGRHFIRNRYGNLRATRRAHKDCVFGVPQNPLYRHRPSVRPCRRLYLAIPRSSSPPPVPAKHSPSSPREPPHDDAVLLVRVLTLAVIRLSWPKPIIRQRRLSGELIERTRGGLMRPPPSICHGQTRRRVKRLSRRPAPGRRKFSAPCRRSPSHHFRTH
jgi:hypothetical protein